MVKVSGLSLCLSLGLIGYVSTGFAECAEALEGDQLLGELRSAYARCVQRHFATPAQREGAAEWKWGILEVKSERSQDVEDLLKDAGRDLLQTAASNAGGQSEVRTADLFVASLWNDPVGIVVLGGSREILIDPGATMRFMTVLSTKALLPGSVDPIDYVATYIFHRASTAPFTHTRLGILSDLEGVIWDRIRSELLAWARLGATTGVDSYNVLVGTDSNTRSRAIFYEVLILGWAKLLRPWGDSPWILWDWLRSSRSTPPLEVVQASASRLRSGGGPLTEGASEARSAASRLYDSLSRTLGPEEFLLVGHAWGWGLAQLGWVPLVEVVGYWADGVVVLPRSTAALEASVWREDGAHQCVQCRYLVESRRRTGMAADERLDRRLGEPVRKHEWLDPDCGFTQLSLWEKERPSGWRGGMVRVSFGEETVEVRFNLRKGTALERSLHGIVESALQVAGADAASEVLGKVLAR